MSEGQRLQLATAHNLATRIRDSFTSDCEKIQIVGSIRRCKATVGDIEFVYIPRFQSTGQTSFLDPAKTESLFDRAILAEIARRPGFHRGAKFGPRFKQCLVDLLESRGQVKVEFYLAEAGNWGYIQMLRTGSAAFNKAWAVRQMDGGVLPNEYRFSGGWLTKAGQRIETPTEQDVFDRLGLPWIEPQERTPEMAYRIRQPQPA